MKNGSSTKRMQRGSAVTWVLAACGLAVLLAAVWWLFFREDPDEWGRYEGELILMPLEDGRMKLLADFTYVDSADKHWCAKEGDLTDGASIPQFLWSIIGGPFVGPKLRAAVVHDRYCVEAQRTGETWQQVHRMFYESMRCAGVDKTKAKIMYSGVYFFGPRWDEVGLSPEWRTTPRERPTLPPLAGRPRSAPDRKLELEQFQQELETWKASEREREAPLEERFEPIERWIREQDPSLDEIENRPVE